MDHHILETEILAIKEATMTLIYKQLSEVIIETESLIAISTIQEEINPPSNFRNFVEDVNILANVVKNIKFICCNRLTNSVG